MKKLEANLTGFKAYKALISLAFEYKSYFYLAIVGMVLFALSEGAFVYTMKPMMDDGFVLRDAETLAWIPFIIIIIFMVRMVASFLRTYCLAYIGRLVINTLRDAMFSKLLSLKTSEYDKSSSATIITKFSYNVEQLASSVSTAITVLIQDTIRVIVFLSIMIYLSWQLTLILLAVGPVIAFIVVKVSARFRRISINIQHSMGDVSHVAQEVIDSNRVVKIFGGADFESEKFANINLRNFKLNLKMTVAQAVSMPLIQFIVAIAFAGILGLASSDSMAENISSGDFVSFIFAMTSLLSPLRSLSEINAKIQKGIAAGESIFELLDLPSEDDNGKQAVKQVKGLIEFKETGFHYDGHDNQVLSGINFTAYPQQTIAIVGRSGSGKSTLVNLLPRLYEVTEGQVLLDGHNITDYTLPALRKQIAYVGQDVHLFNDSIRNNIAYGGLLEATDEDIINAAKQAYAWEFIESMPAGMDTLVGEKGLLLSGGQRQRLAIARALLKDAPILILDEATSSLDTESERHIQHAIDNLLINRTTLVIAHRLSTVEHADLIIVMDDGVIVEQGTHQQLIELDGVYGRLHSMQFRDQP